MHDLYAEERRRLLRLERRERNSLIAGGIAYILLVLLLV